MKFIHKRTIIGLFAVLVLCSGCAKRYVITNNLESPLPEKITCHIGEIRDELPDDFDAGKKPTAEDIDKFRNYLVEELLDEGVTGSAEAYDSTFTDFQINAAILDYKKGSGFLRFLFGFVGESRVTVHLEMVQRQSSQVVFAGNFTGTVTTELETGDYAFKHIAHDFAKAIEKRNDKLLKGK